METSDDTKKPEIKTVWIGGPPAIFNQLPVTAEELRKKKNREAQLRWRLKNPVRKKKER